MAEEADRIVLADVWGMLEHAEDLAWRPFREGVEIYPLYGGEDDQPAAALLRYAPGARVPRHVHRGHEHILVLRGAQEDDYGSYPAGHFIVNGPGSQHTVASETGCIVLIIWHRPVQFV